MHQYFPTGEAGMWMGALGKAVPGYYQPVKVILPSTGDVTIFSGRMIEPVSISAPAQFGVSVGYAYRIQIRNLPEFPGVELYPTIELLDRLHPPAGEENNFPIPIHLTESDLEQVLSGRMVTKVVYLEQPQMAVPQQTEGESLHFDLPPRNNLLAEADLMGRPLAIVRIGGRIPDRTQDLRSYLWSPAPLTWETEAVGAASLSSIRRIPAQAARRNTKAATSRKPDTTLPAGPRVFVSSSFPVP